MRHVLVKCGYDNNVTTTNQETTQHNATMSCVAPAVTVHVAVVLRDVQIKSNQIYSP